MKEINFNVIFLFVLILVYLILGALLFQALESDYEVQLGEEYRQLFQTLKIENNLSDTLMTEIMLTHQKACYIGMPNSKNPKWSLSKF